MNQDLIQSLQQKLWRSLQLAAPDRNSSYAILDFPNHSNIGDSAIYTGEVILLQKYFNKESIIVTEAHGSDIDQIEKVIDRIDIIFLHGGGNFGDLWPRHQNFREAIIRKFSQKKIIQLPQTIYYKNSERLEASSQIINSHPDFTLMVRDEKSKLIAQSTFNCEISLTPDMAFMIGDVQPVASRQYDILALMRDDQEGKFSDNSDLANLAGSYLAVDWPAENHDRSIFSRLKNKIIPDTKKIKTPNYYRNLASRRVRTGLNLLSSGEIVVTDRLHAHILSLLL